MDLKVELQFFPTQTEFRDWLEKNHDKKRELFVGYYKVNSGKPSMSWSESVDQALCFGWIDGLRKSVDSESYFIRFTPRNPKSIWSAINIAKVEQLTKQGLMKPAGVALFNMRKESRSRIYTYENGSVNLSDEFEVQFKTYKKGWEFFMSMPFSYRKPAISWVMSAKQQITRIKRLTQLINDSEAGRKIKQLSY